METPTNPVRFNLSDEVSFEASDDLGFGLALGRSSGHVGLGALVEPHADDDDAVERCVGLPVSTSVESVTVGPAGRGWDGVDAA